MSADKDPPAPTGTPTDWAALFADECSRLLAEGVDRETARQRLAPILASADEYGIDWTEAVEEGQVFFRRHYPDPGHYRTIGMGEFLAIEIPPRETVCGFLTASTLTLIVAWRGTGKTLVALGIAVAAASGGRFLHWKAPKPRRVLYVDGELPEEDLQARVRLAAATVTDQQVDPGENLRILSAAVNRRSPNLAEAEGRAAVEEHLEEVGILVLDSLSTLCRGGEENKAESWQPIQDWLVLLRARGIAVVLLHHTGKDKATQRGTSKRDDVLDWSLLLKHPSDYVATDGARFEIAFDKTRHRGNPEDVAPVEAHLGTDEYGTPWWTIKPLADVRDTRIVQLREEGLTVREIAEEMKLSKSAVSRALKKHDAGGRS